MGKANNNHHESFGDSTQRPAELVDLEKASEALEIPREILWGLLQHEAVPVQSFQQGKHDVPAIWQRDLERLRSSAPPDPKQVFARMFGQKFEQQAPVAPVAPVVMEPAENATPPALAFETKETPAFVPAAFATSVAPPPSAPAAAAGEAPFASVDNAEVETLRRQLELAKTELEKHAQPLWVRLRTIQHEHEQAVFEARLAKGQLTDAKTRLAHSEETLTVLRRDLAKTLEISEFERRRRQDSEETQQRLVAACERFERVNQRLTQATEELATVRGTLNEEQAKSRESDTLRQELMAEREKLAALERRFLESERRHADELRARAQNPVADPQQVAAFQQELAGLRRTQGELQSRLEASQRARLAQERYCERIEVRLSEALARITKLQRLSEGPPQRSAA
jgi:hypothetical protein